MATDFSGGFCSSSADCAKLRRQVDAPGVLVLADNQGSETFQLTAAQYGMVVDLVLDPAFERAIDDPSDCHPTPDTGGRVDVSWKDTGLRTDAASSCIDGRMASDHIYNRLTWMLVDLQKQHLDCSASTPRLGIPGRRLCDVCNIEPC